MVPVPTSYLNVPIFGSGASNIVPEPTTYAGGFLPGQLFPAEYENWLMNRLTNNESVSQTTNLSVAAEIVTVLSHASITPDPVSTNQLYAALNALYATVSDLASEASTRGSADTTLQSNINAEATARANADTTLQSNINLKADIASPTFTGTPAAPTPSTGDNTTKVATTAFVTTAVAVKKVSNYAATGTNLALNVPSMQIGELTFIWVSVTGSVSLSTPNASGSYIVSGNILPTTANPLASNTVISSSASGLQFSGTIYRVS